MCISKREKDLIVFAGYANKQERREKEAIRFIKSNLRDKAVLLYNGDQYYPTFYVGARPINLPLVIREGTRSSIIKDILGPEQNEKKFGYDVKLIWWDIPTVKQLNEIFTKLKEIKDYDDQEAKEKEIHRFEDTKEQEKRNIIYGPYIAFIILTQPPKALVIRKARTEDLGPLKANIAAEIKIPYNDRFNIKDENDKFYYNNKLVAFLTSDPNEWEKYKKKEIGIA